MKISIGDHDYRKIKNLHFSPETDIISNELVINDFSADIVTKRNIEAGKNAFLYDDSNNLWAKYRITESKRISVDVVRIEAQSKLKMLERKRKPKVMYVDEPVSNIVDSLLANVGDGQYRLDPGFSQQTISGYCPKQTAKERLQWVCFCIGAYVKTFFSNKIEILPVDETKKTIPIKRTYWRPSISYDDYVTSVSVTAYTYTEGQPQTTDDWVKVDDKYYIETSQEFTLNNPNVPSYADENVVSIDKITIINQNNVSDILSTLSTYYFKRTVVDAEIINNADYEPGEKVTLKIDDDTRVAGFIQSMDFSFGKLTKSKIRLTQAAMIDDAKLIIKRMYNNKIIQKDTYYFPVGYQYEIDNPFVDRTKSGTRKIYRPQNKKATGTMLTGTNTNTQNYDIALKWQQKELTVYSVDDVEMSNKIVRIK